MILSAKVSKYQNTAFLLWDTTCAVVLEYEMFIADAILSGTP